MNDILYKYWLACNNDDNKKRSKNNMSPHIHLGDINIYSNSNIHHIVNNSCNKIITVFILYVNEVCKRVISL